MAYKLGIYGPLHSKALSAYEKLGVDAVFTDVTAEKGPEVDDSIRRARDSGMDVYACAWAFKAPSKDSRFGIVNVYGETTFWAGAGCPNNPTIREHNLAWTRRVLENQEISGIVLDGIRFPSPGSGLRVLLSCFCGHCRRRMRDWGIDPEEISRSLRSLETVRRGSIDLLAARGELSAYSQGGELRGWTSFRCRSISDHVEALVETAREVDPSASVGAAVFAPGLSLLVGQDYRRLCRSLDFVQPMVYERGDGIACINFEIARLVEELFQGLEERSLKGIYEALEYGERHPSSTASLKADGLCPEVVEIEAVRARVLTGHGMARLTPVLFTIHASSGEVKDLIDRARSSKPDGLVLFAYEESA